MDRKAPVPPTSFIDALLQAFGGGSLAYFVILLIIAHVAVFVYWIIRVFQPTAQGAKRE